MINRMVFFTGAAIVALALCCGSAEADLIVNGSFETPDVGTSFGLFPNGGVPGWTGSNNQMEIDYTPILSPRVGTPAYDGKQSTEIDQTVNSISQVVTGLTPGQSYVLFWGFGLRPGDGAQGLDVLFGGSQVGSSRGTAGPVGSALIWTPYSVSVTATSESETLTFRAAGGTRSEGNELDAVSLSASAVPEPSTLALVAIGGLCLAGSAVLRRGHRAVR